MREATLYLKDGRSYTISLPGDRIQEVIHYMRLPAAAAAGKTVRLNVPAGETLAVPAADIASIEIPPPHAMVRDFMTPGELSQIWDFTEGHLDGFQASGAYNAHDPRNTALTRRSRILDGPDNGTMAGLVFPKLQALMPSLWPQLNMRPTPLNKLECQITAHGDGDFFGIHIDNGAPSIAYRQVSYVFYFHREPKQFSGGLLRLYNTLIEGGTAKCGSHAVDIDPPGNSVIIFPPSIYHEVTPIRCASSALADQRLTLNGWMFLG
jgi:SM-20-related protein